MKCAEFLNGVTILDMSRILAGPFATMILGDLGAGVIKVEDPEKGDDTRSWGPPFAKGESAYFLGINRNKKSIAVNLKHPDGQEIIRSLITQSDVLVENFKRGGLDFFNLSLKELKRLNPRLITCSIKGFGARAPKAYDPGYDVAMQARCGLMSTTGPKGTPMKVGFAIVDIATGLYAAIAILSALYQRNISGKGMHIEVPLLNSGLAILPTVAQNYLISGEISGSFGNQHPNIVPYRPFKTKDEKEIIVSVGNDKQWNKFCSVICREDLKDDGRFATNAERVKNRDALDQILEPVFLEKSASEWMTILEKDDIVTGPIQNFAEVFSDPNITDEGMVITADHPSIGKLRLIDSPFRFFGNNVLSGQDVLPPPLLGQHTREILIELGYDENEIAKLSQQKIIKVSE